MGILDEAIRNHLDLKRRHGAAEDDLKRLEDEAFGPPTRPGEPDFPEQETNGDAEVGTEEAEALTPEEPLTGDHAADETAETAEEPEAEVGESVAEHEEAAGGAEQAELEPAEPGGFFDQDDDELDLAELDLELDAEEARVEEELATELEEDDF